MTNKEIEKELRRIYKEMRSWPKINKNFNYMISNDEVKRRELFLIGREELFKLESAKECKNKLSEDVHEATYNLIKTTLESY